MIDAGLVEVDGEPVKPSYKISPGETITIKLQPRPQPSFDPENIPLDVVYEDPHLVIINKPAGMVVHPAQGNWSGTMMNALIGRYHDLREKGEEFRGGIVHRLDKDTTGLLVAARDEYTLGELGKQFSARTIERKYQALVWGHPRKRTGDIEANLGRSSKDRKVFTVTDDGKPALTRYRVAELFENLSLLELSLATGRTHQIRVHMKHFGHPVFGDATYGGRYAGFGNLTSAQRVFHAGLLNIMQRQALHAGTLGFLHPVKREFMRFECELPEDFAEVLRRLRNK